MITEDYVSFETAKLLKEKEFPQNPYICNTAYTLRGKLSNNAKSFVHNFTEFNKCGIKPLTYSMAPTLQMTMKWLREVHNLCIEPYRTACGYLYTISTIPYGSCKCNPKEGGDDEDSGQWTTYEGACEAAIRYCLENLITPSSIPENK